VDLEVNWTRHEKRGNGEQGTGNRERGLPSDNDNRRQRTYVAKTFSSSNCAYRGD